MAADAGKTFRSLDEVDVRGKRVLLRLDLNVPMKDGKVTDTTRIQRILSGVRELADKGGKVIVLSHFGRPKGKVDPESSMRPVAEALANELGRPVAFAEDCIGATAEAAIAKLADGDVLMLENARFHKGEEANDPAFVAEVAKLGDLFVNDAFSAAHRAHATTEGVAHVLPAYAGRTMQAELEHIGTALNHPDRPMAAVVGGAKVSTKLDLLGNLSGKVDRLIIGGGMANTFLYAQGKSVGASLCEKEMADTAREIMTRAEKNGCEIVLPVDAVVAEKFAAGAPDEVVSVDAVPDGKMILDIGPQSVARIEALLQDVKTLVWNGPFGAFEIAPFDRGTVRVAQAAAALTKAGRLVTVAGGGDTVAALNQAGVARDFTYISTAGGAFLEWLEGKELPGVEALRP
ncbi:phosphoglycerate kinase [Beijerinckiaceae bacterium RH AL1]|nr:phosphoglycerate kinase [Beijerinckiaceae bacterium]VVB42545.1 phosphoglycerate kinase [Beijerinckiaceae bacterium RH AL8]VVB42546.1 phosphoglycerate kinase [Beijerinckiaceae bacterium RH CH11]VVC53363.1 phosphoglycerate kinase [Beijerinckiaceae bacterium RH AL1]